MLADEMSVSCQRVLGLLAKLFSSHFRKHLEKAFTVKFNSFSVLICELTTYNIKASAAQHMYIDALNEMYRRCDMNNPLLTIEHQCFIVLSNFKTRDS